MIIFPYCLFIIIWGKCRKCSEKISVRYPLVEASTAFLFVLVYVAYNSCILNNLQTSPFCAWQQSLGVWALPYFLIITAILVAVFVIDLEHKLIFDELVFSGFAITFIVLILTNPDGLYGYLFAGFAAAVFFLLLNLLTKGRGMGLGDSKLSLFLGSILGVQMSIIWLFTGFVTGAVVGVALIAAGKAKFGRHIPFGPFLVASFFATLLWGERIVELIFPYLVSN
jgi:leader peptidase (prepilin peptidase) / N-methyltransferase